jgi:autotransporter strand-loop-strand O-heptosyltransferase
MFPLRPSTMIALADLDVAEREVEAIAGDDLAEAEGAIARDTEPSPLIAQLAAITPAVDRSSPNSDSVDTGAAQSKELTRALHATVAATYPLPAKIPVEHGEGGLRFDFNCGARVLIPRGRGSWRVRFSDQDTGNVLFDTEVADGWVASTKRYYVRFRIEAWRDGAQLLDLELELADRPVLIQFPLGTLGDAIGWMTYAGRFQEQHGCRLTLAMGEAVIPLFRDAYPEIAFVTHDQVEPERFYATYNVGLFFHDDAAVWQPADFRHVGLHKTAAYILGVEPDESPPRLAIVDPHAPRPIAERYVVIAVQSTARTKWWNNPTGWLEVVEFLQAAGYRVICIDQQAVDGHGLHWQHMPRGAEDQTGDRPLLERAHWLRHAEFFVGLSSGLAWLAWAAGCPVVMISGFTHPTNEFATPHRVINYHACNSCWNDPRVRFDHRDFMWCPRHAGTGRQFECSRLITVEHVKRVLRAIPGFGDQARRAP